MEGYVATHALSASPNDFALKASEQELASPSSRSPSSSSPSEQIFKTEDSQYFDFDPQHALIDATPYPQRVVEEPYQRIKIREPQPSFLFHSLPEYYPAPGSQLQDYQQTPSYMSYVQQFMPLSPAPSTAPASPILDRPSHHYGGLSSPENFGVETTRQHCYNALTPEEDNDDNFCDKPYARLIYEALMQAPGHRMMLREIYDWFKRNTTKPAESGTNGWQNSIRHNLSMNQAFENDKPDSTHQGEPKQKFNSVWILTEDAIENGVQSTTRYRKTGSGKRMNGNRVPAPLRQRSGAKGGKAARRAAQLRKREQRLHHHQPSPLRFTQSQVYDYDAAPIDTSESNAFSVYNPATPPSVVLFHSGADHPASRYSTDMPVLFKQEDEYAGDEMDSPVYGMGYPSARDFYEEEMLKAQDYATAADMPT